MPTVVADAAMIDKLAGLTEPADIVDPDGRKLGRFTPEPVPAEPLCPWEPTLTRAEVERRIRESKGRTWAEIRKRLERMRPL
jgi:hypothetical protein